MFSKTYLLAHQVIKIGVAVGERLRHCSRDHKVPSLITRFFISVEVTSQ